MKCECGKELTEEEIEQSEIVCTDTKLIYICYDCWYNYANHATTGE